MNGTQIPESEAMTLLARGIELLKPFGPPSLEQLRLIRARISNRENQTEAATEIKQNAGLERINRLLDFYGAILREPVHVPETKPPNVGKSNY